MRFSQRSKDALKGVDPRMVRLMEAAILTTPIDFTVIEGVRSQATQQKYYTWGRTVVNPNTGKLAGKPFGKRVTNRDGVIKKSEHQVKASGYGEAVDICPFVNGGLDWDNDRNFHIIAAHIKKVAAVMGIRITWGGDWRDPYDAPHYELKH